MKERPILMSAPMIRALLENRKTQTRRVVKWDCEIPKDSETAFCREGLWYFGDKAGTWFFPGSGIKCPFGVEGDRFWVRETFKVIDTRVVYAADPVTKKADEVDRAFGPWRPSIFMPRWACRIRLEVVSVRVERLQDMTEADAKAEGADRESESEEILTAEDHASGYTTPAYHLCGFERLWNRLNARRGYGWDTNPWVWVIEFRRVT